MSTGCEALLKAEEEGDFQVSPTLAVVGVFRFCPPASFQDKTKSESFPYSLSSSPSSSFWLL